MKAYFDLLACGQSCKTASVITELFITVFIGESWSPPFNPRHLPLLLALGRNSLGMKKSNFFFLLFSFFFFAPNPVFPSSATSGHEEDRGGGVGSRLSLARNPEGSRGARLVWPAHSAPQILSRPASPQVSHPWGGLW